MSSLVQSGGHGLSRILTLTAQSIARSAVNPGLFPRVDPPFRPAVFSGLPRGHAFRRTEARCLLMAQTSIFRCCNISFGFERLSGPDGSLTKPPSLAPAPRAYEIAKSAAGICEMLASVRSLARARNPSDWRRNELERLQRDGVRRGSERWVTIRATRLPALHRLSWARSEVCCAGVLRRLSSSGVLPYAKIWRACTRRCLGQKGRSWKTHPTSNHEAFLRLRPLTPCGKAFRILDTVSRENTVANTVKR